VVRTDHSLAPLVAVLGIAVLTGMDAVMKIVTTSYPIGEVLCLRYVAGAVFAVVAFLVAGELRPSWGALRRNFSRAIVVLVTSACFFTAIARLPLAEAIALTFMAPLFLSLLGWLILKEPVAPRALLGIVLGLVGVVVIGRGQEVDSSHAFDPIGIAAALGCALSYALSNVLMRKQSGQDSMMTLVMLCNVFAMVLSAPLMIAHWHGPTAWHLGAFVAAGLLGTCGQCCMAWAYARAPAGRLGVLEYTSFLWGSILGFLFFAEVPTAWTVAGAALILLACVASTWRPRRRIVSV